MDLTQLGMLAVFGLLVIACIADFERRKNRRKAVEKEEREEFLRRLTDKNEGPR